MSLKINEKLFLYVVLMCAWTAQKTDHKRKLPSYDPSYPPVSCRDISM